MVKKDYIEKLVYDFVFTIFVLILYAFFSLVWSIPLMFAWNYVMPSIFGLGQITYLQMFALFFILTSLWKINVINSD